MRSAEGGRGLRVGRTGPGTPAPFTLRALRALRVPLAPLALGAIVTLAGGCALLPGPRADDTAAGAPPAVQAEVSAPDRAATPGAPTPGAAPSAKTARTAAAAATVPPGTNPSPAAPSANAAPAPGTVRIDPRPPVDAAAQRAFDEALRLLRAGRHAEAERAFKALAAAHPTLAGPHANLALLHRRAGREAEAVAALEEAVRLSPEQPVYLNALGIAYREAGRFDKARDAYERAIVLDAGYAAPQLNLAILLDLYLGDRARAAEWYQRSAVLLPADAPQIQKWLAEIKSRKPEANVASAGGVAANVAARKEKP